MQSIYLKRRINVLPNYGTHKIKIEGFGEKYYRTLLWQLKFKNEKVQEREV